MFSFNFKLSIATLLIVFSSLTAANPLSKVDLKSTKGERPDPTNMIQTFGPVMAELRSLGPVQLQRVSASDTKLTLGEKFSDGSSYQRVFKTAEESESAIAKLPKAQDKDSDYPYWATVEGSFYSGGQSYGYSATYGSYDGETWFVINISLHAL